MSKFQEEYDTIRDKAHRLYQRNPGAFPQMEKFAKQSKAVRLKAERAGDPVIVRPRGWLKEEAS